MTFNKDIKNSESLGLDNKANPAGDISVSQATGCPVWNLTNETWGETAYTWNLCSEFLPNTPNVTPSASLDSIPASSATINLTPSDDLIIDRFGSSSFGNDNIISEKLNISLIPSADMNLNKITRTFYNDFFNNIEDKFNESEYYFGDVESGWQVAS